MKEQIQEIIERHLYTVSDSIEVCDNLGGQSIAADELQALMCYREVKAIMSWHQFASYPDYSMDIVYQLRDAYAPSLILSCIEKVKSKLK
jgi:hypothetical protein